MQKVPAGEGQEIPLCVQPALASAAPCASALDSSSTKCVALGQGESVLSFLVDLQHRAQSHSETVHAPGLITPIIPFKLPPEPSAVEKFLNGTTISGIQSQLCVSA